MSPRKKSQRKRRRKGRRKRESVDEITKMLFKYMKKPKRKREERTRYLALVTGATGRLGRRLVPSLLRKGWKVRALVREGGRLPKNVEEFKGDLSDAASLRRAVEDVDYVFHLAALVDYDAPLEKLLEINYRGTRNLLEACREKAYSLKRFVYVSTIGVFGKEPINLPADESTPPNPSDPYSRSKLMAERTVLDYSDKIPIVIIRPSVIYGPGFERDFFKILRLLEEERLPIIGDGNNFVPLIHVDDVIKALVAAAERDEAIGEVYVIAPEERVTQEELFRIACGVLDIPMPGRSSKFMTFLKMKLMKLLGMVKERDIEYLRVLSSNRVFDVSKAKRQLGFFQSVPTKDGLLQMIKHYKEGGSYV